MFFVIPGLILLKCDFMHEQESRDFGQILNAHQITKEVIQESSGFSSSSSSSFSSIYGWMEQHAKHVNVTPRETSVTREKIQGTIDSLHNPDSLCHISRRVHDVKKDLAILCHLLNFHFTHFLERERERFMNNIFHFSSKFICILQKSSR